MTTDKIKSTHTTPDGQTFDTRVLAEAHMEMLAITPLAMKFARQHLPDDASIRTINRTFANVIAWEAWKREYGNLIDVIDSREEATE